MRGGLVSMPLYQLADMREQLDTELFLADGVLTPAQERRFDAINGTVDQKVERIGLLICEALATAKAIEHEEERLAARRRALLNQVERRKEFLRLIMARLQKKRVVGTLCTVTLQDNSVVSVSTATPAAAGPQRDLFARGRPSHQRRGERGQHVRVR